MNFGLFVWVIAAVFMLGCDREIHYHQTTSEVLPIEDTSSNSQDGAAEPKTDDRGSESSSVLASTGEVSEPLSENFSSQDLVVVGEPRFGVSQKSVETEPDDLLAFSDRLLVQETDRSGFFFCPICLRWLKSGLKWCGRGLKLDPFPLAKFPASIGMIAKLWIFTPRWSAKLVV